jgi:hypothetical protein
MPKRTWKDGRHHWFDKNDRKYVPGGAYDNCTTPMPGEEHVQAHRDKREVGVIGSIARYDLRRWLGRHRS